MPCDYKSREAMAEAGWTEEEIVQMEKEVQLARAKANQTAAEIGLTRTQQRALEEKAEHAARVEAHDRMHRKLKEIMDVLLKGNTKVLVHANTDGKGHLSAAGREALKKMGFDF